MCTSEAWPSKSVDSKCVHLTLGHSFCHQSSHGTHLIPITCLLIPCTCCTSSSPSISDHSQLFLLVRSTVHYTEPYQSLSLVYPVCTYPQMLQRSSDPDLLDSSTIPNLPAKDTASAFSDKNPRTAQSVSTHLLTVTSVSLCNSVNKPTGVCINPFSPACVLCQYHSKPE